jgi:hypothetical protein
MEIGERDRPRVAPGIDFRPSLSMEGCRCQREALVVKGATSTDFRCLLLVLSITTLHRTARKQDRGAHVADIQIWSILYVPIACLAGSRATPGWRNCAAWLKRRPLCACRCQRANSPTFRHSSYARHEAVNSQHYSERTVSTRKMTSEPIRTFPFAYWLMFVIIAFVALPSTSLLCSHPDVAYIFVNDPARCLSHSHPSRKGFAVGVQSIQSSPCGSTPAAGSLSSIEQVGSSTPYVSTPSSPDSGST